MTVLDTSKPLAGVRVVSFTQLLLGPGGVQYLSDLGADVVKIENPDGGAWERKWAGGDAFIDGTSVFFLLGNRNQRGLTLNLKHPDAHKIVSRLLDEADILVQNFRPGVMERLGFGYEQLHEAHPRLVYISASGYGDTGPYRDRPGQDLLLQSLAGLASITGPASGPPVPTGAAIVDQHGAALLALAALAALRLRDQTGRGTKIEVSLLLAALDLQQEPMGYHLNGFPFARSEAGLASGYHPGPYGIYATLDGFVALSLSPLEDLARVEEFNVLGDLQGRSPFAVKEAVRQRLEPVIARNSAEYWIDHLTSLGIWCGPVKGYDAVFEDPQVEHVQPTVGFEYPGVGRVTVLGLPFKIEGYEPEVRRPPQLGEHTGEVLGELGFTPTEIEQLRRDGVI